MKLLADGKEAKDLDGKAVPAVTLSEDGAWVGEFNNLVINNAQTDEAVKYTVEEQTPSGFVSAVTGSQKDGYTVTNTIIRGNIVVHKVSADKDDAPLAGAKFELRSGDSVIASAVTGKDGKATFKDVEFGSYTVVETAAPEGYVLNAKPLDVSVKENGKTVDAGVVENSMIRGSIIALKKDAKSGKVLAGAQFEIRDTQGNVVRTVVSNDKGEVVANDVMYGEYILVETKAPQGYKLDDTPHKFEIRKNLEEVDLGEIKNDPIPSKALAITGSSVAGMAVIAVLAVVTAGGLVMVRGSRAKQRKH